MPLNWDSIMVAQRELISEAYILNPLRSKKRRVLDLSVTPPKVTQIWKGPTI